MNVARILVIAAAASCIVSHASAQDSGAYVGAGVGGYNTDLDLQGMTGQVYAGYTVNPYFAGELTYAYFDKDHVNFGAGQVSIESDVYAASLLPMIPFGESVSLFGRIGYGRYDVSASGGGTNASGNDDDYYWGGGVQYRADAHMSFRGELTCLGNDTNEYSYGVAAHYNF